MIKILLVPEQYGPNSFESFVDPGEITRAQDPFLRLPIKDVIDINELLKGLDPERADKNSLEAASPSAKNYDELSREIQNVSELDDVGIQSFPDSSKPSFARLVKGSVALDVSCLGPMTQVKFEPNDILSFDPATILDYGTKIFPQAIYSDWATRKPSGEDIENFGVVKLGYANSAGSAEQVTFRIRDQKSEFERRMREGSSPLGVCVEVSTPWMNIYNLMISNPYRTSSRAALVVPSRHNFNFETIKLIMGLEAHLQESVESKFDYAQAFGTAINMYNRFHVGANLLPPSKAS